MQDRPSPQVILDLAIAQLDALDPSSARAKFEMRMTSAALKLVSRAIGLQPDSDAAELSRLVVLLKEEGDLETLNRHLCQRIRGGALSMSAPGLAAHLRATTMEKLAVDQPTYADYQSALQRTEG